MMKRAAVYARVSTQLQAEKGFSLAEQLDVLPKLARSKGYLVEDQDIFVDIQSGADNERPGYRHLLARVQEGHYAAIFVMERSRLSRTTSRLEEEKIINILKQYGCLVITPAATLEPFSLEGELIWDILAAIDRSERKRLKIRLDSGKAAKWRSGYYVGCNPPYGYRPGFDPITGQKRLYIYEPEMERVRLAFSLLREGLSLMLINREFVYQGYRTKNGGPYYACNILLWVRNHHYAGYTRRGYSVRRNTKERFLLPFNHYLDPILSKKEFNFIQRYLDSKIPFSKQAHVYPLAGLLLCPFCGEKTSSIKSGGRFTYACASLSRKEKNCIGSGRKRHFPREAAHLQAIIVIEYLIRFLELHWDDYQRVEEYSFWLIQGRLNAYKERYHAEIGVIKKALKNEEQLSEKQYNTLRKVFFMFFSELHYRVKCSHQRSHSCHMTLFKTQWGETFKMSLSNDKSKLQRVTSL